MALPAITGDAPAARTIWARGGLTVTGLAAEFRDPAWKPRGQYRAILQFVMNWNGWPDPEDRAAMLDGPPSDTLTEDEKARIAAVVHALCERDGHPLPEWATGHRAARRGGIRLTADRPYRDRWRRPTAHSRRVKRRTPPAARTHRVWFDAATLDKA